VSCHRPAPASDDGPPQYLWAAIPDDDFTADQIPPFIIPKASELNGDGIGFLVGMWLRLRSSVSRI